MFGVAIIFSLVASTYAVYNDSLARNKILPLVSAAYDSAPSRCINKFFNNAFVQRQLTVTCDFDKNDNCSGYTGVSNDDRAIIIAFRGNPGFLQFVIEGIETIFKDKTPFIAGGKVSEYFYNGFDLLWTGGMRDDFLSLKNKYPSYQLWVVGHSLGGSLASIAAGTIVKLGLMPANKVSLITMGQPRTGDVDFANAQDSQLTAPYRITHNRDIVAHIPPENFENYWHHKNEVWYPNDMKLGAPYMECDADESDNCSDSDFFTTSMDDHLHYFTKHVINWGESGCIN